MQIHGPSHVHGAHGVKGPHQNRGAAPSQAAAQPTSGDQLEISPAAEAAINAADKGGFRADLVERVRNEIESGTYESPDKLDAALDRLLNEIG